MSEQGLKLFQYPSVGTLPRSSVHSEGPNESSKLSSKFQRGGNVELAQDQVELGKVIGLNRI